MRKPATPQASTLPYGKERTEVAALCVGNALGTCVGFIVPVWIAAFVRDGFFTITEVGWLASVQLAILATAGIATSARGRPFNLKGTAVGLALLIALGTAVAAIHSKAAVIFGLFLFAAASGVLHSIMVRAGSARSAATKVLALMTAAAMAFGGTTTFASRRAIELIGTPGLFLMVSMLSILGSLLMLRGLATEAPSAPRSVASVRFGVAELHKIGAILACTAGALVNMAATTSGAYSVVIGSGLGFPASATTAALAMSEPLALLGPLISHRLGERWGLTRPILVALAVLIANQFFLVHAATPALLSLSFVIGGVTFAFYIPYVMALVGRLDQSGRLVGALPGLMTIGASVGPALGGAVIVKGSFRTLAPVAAFILTVAWVLFAWASTQAEARSPQRRRVDAAP